MGPLILSHSVLLSSEYFSECGTLNSAELNICCNIHSVQLSRGEGLYSAPLSISNLPLERFGDVYFEKNVDRCWKFAQCGKIFCTVWQFLAFSHLNMIIRVSGLIHWTSNLFKVFISMVFNALTVFEVQNYSKKPERVILFDLSNYCILEPGNGWAVSTHFVRNSHKVPPRYRCWAKAFDKYSKLHKTQFRYWTVG